MRFFATIFGGRNSPDGRQELPGFDSSNDVER